MKEILKAVFTVILLIVLVLSGFMLFSLGYWLGTASKALELVCIALSALSFYSVWAIIDRV